ncbi:MAG TPA: CAP domain-containing protein [Frankiaceae bacterium]|nr:CAP domain-containing protein [Frankiaceae bacterium]
MLRRFASVLVASTIALTGLAAAAPSASASTQESQFVSLTNGARSNKGLRTYGVASDLVSVARRHAQRMASQKSLYHNPNLGSEVSGWQAVGENVGMGGSVSSIHNAFMNSTAHRANILDTDFTQVGIGVAFDSDGVMYVTEVFRKPSGSTSVTPAPRPRPVATARPRTTYKPAVAPKPVAKPVARKPVARKPVVKRPDPRAQLAARLAHARQVASARAAESALEHAVVYVDVMGSLA